jgi:amino acid transporter/nucleotide-binding universal stress UspA family protein
MHATLTKRPRNVDTPRAAAILYGDWGTSKAYVIGLAFAIAGYSSFWLILAIGVLTCLVGINYMTICRYYPNGGGVYASVRHRSQILSIVGAFLIMADYIVTAALSALSACLYLDVPYPVECAAIAILGIGALNYFGPRNTGSIAFLISIPVVVVVVLISLFALPHLGEAIKNVQPIQNNWMQNWHGFVGVVLALSGVEAVANATGVMKLNPGCTEANPSVSKTSNRAILLVMIEVCFFTVLFALAVNAIGGLVIHAGDVDAPGNPGVRDYMLRYMAEVFCGNALGAAAGQIAGWAVSIVFGVLLFSAVNTAIVDLVAISFLMSGDGELPGVFKKLNPFGVPNLGLLLAALIPASIVFFVKDLAGLANLYAVGVAGAIATNLGATGTDKKLDLARWERWLMLFTFVIMVAIVISILIDKPAARFFAVTILAVGLILRGLATERAEAKKQHQISAQKQMAHTGMTTSLFDSTEFILSRTPIVCAVRGVGRTLDFAFQEARETRRPLHVLYIHRVPVLSKDGLVDDASEDAQAQAIFSYAQEIAQGHPCFMDYAISEAPAKTIVDVATNQKAEYLILGSTSHHRLVAMLSGNITKQVAKLLPDSINLIVYV